MKIETKRRLNYDKENTDLPENPDYKRITEFVMDVNEMVVCGSKIFTDKSCEDCIKAGGDWECDHIHCHKGEIYKE